MVTENDRVIQFWSSLESKLCELGSLTKSKGQKLFGIHIFKAVHCSRVKCTILLLCWLGRSKHLWLLKHSIGFQDFSNWFGGLAYIYDILPGSWGICDQEYSVKKNRFEAICTYCTSGRIPVNVYVLYPESEVILKTIQTILFWRVMCGSFELET